MKKLESHLSKMGIENIILWPFQAAFAGATFILAVILIIFWIFMIIDCAKRKFKNDIEKIIWIMAIVLTTWLGALIYYIVVKTYNQKGLTK